MHYLLFTTYRKKRKNSECFDLVMHDESDAMASFTELENGADRKLTTGNQSFVCTVGVAIFLRNVSHHE